MLGRLIKDTLVFAAGAAVGAGVLWLMSDDGKEMRGELRDLAEQAKQKNLKHLFLREILKKEAFVCLLQPLHQRNLTPLFVKLQGLNFQMVKKEQLTFRAKVTTFKNIVSCLSVAERSRTFQV